MESNSSLESRQGLISEGEIPTNQGQNSIPASPSTIRDSPKKRNTRKRTASTASLSGPNTRSKSAAAAKKQKIDLDLSSSIRESAVTHNTSRQATNDSQEGSISDATVEDDEDTAVTSNTSRQMVTDSLERSKSSQTAEDDEDASRAPTRYDPGEISSGETTHTDEGASPRPNTKGRGISSQPNGQPNEESSIGFDRWYKEFKCEYRKNEGCFCGLNCQVRVIDMMDPHELEALIAQMRKKFPVPSMEGQAVGILLGLRKG